MAYTISRIKEEGGRVFMYKITFARKPKKRTAQHFINALMEKSL